MSWVERYGIVGVYFFVLIFLLFCLIFDWQFIWSIFYVKDINLLVEFGILLAALTFPVGYLLVTTSQYIYYKCPCLGWQIHPEIIKIIKENNPNIFKKYKIPIQKKQIDELSAEHIVVKLTRLIDRNAIEKDKNNVQEWISKRSYVMAVNSAIIVATAIGIILAIVFLFMLFGIDRKGQFGPFDILNVIILAGLVVINIGFYFQNIELAKLQQNVILDYVITMASKNIKNNKRRKTKRNTGQLPIKVERKI